MSIMFAVITLTVVSCIIVFITVFTTGTANYTFVMYMVFTVLIFHYILYYKH